MVPHHQTSPWKAAVVKSTSQRRCQAVVGVSLGVLKASAGAYGPRGIIAARGSHRHRHPAVTKTLEQSKESVTVNAHSLGDVDDVSGYR